MTRQGLWFRVLPLLLIGGLYASSFFLLAIDFGTDTEGPGPAGVGNGREAFLCGLFALLIGLPVPVWVANPLLWLGMVFLGRGDCRRAGWAGLAAVLFGLSELLFALVAGAPDSGGADVYAWFRDRHLAGYYVWLSSMALLTAAGALGARVGGRAPGAAPPAAIPAP